MSDMVSDLIRPFVVRGLFSSAEEAITEMAQDYVLRQIEHYRQIQDNLSAKYGMSYEQFNTYLHARANTLAHKPDLQLNQAVIAEEEDALDWKIAREMLMSWMGLPVETSQ